MLELDGGWENFFLLLGNITQTEEPRTGLN
jgi:hypothetical protein